MIDSIAVIGSGNGGTAIAAYLTSRGAKVRLSDPFPQYLDGLLNNRKIELVHNDITQEITIDVVTADISKAISGAKLIMVVTPSFTHKIIAKAVAPFLEDGQVVILNPGRTGGAVEFLEVIKRSGCKKHVIIGEASTLIYSCRRVSPTRVEIYGVKKEVLLGTIPANKTSVALEIINKYYPQFIAGENCFETSLSNIGALFHPTPMLLNIGRIESDKNGFCYYTDGISPAVAKLIKAIDNERLAVANAYGVKILSVEKWMMASYPTHGKDLYTLLQNTDAYKPIKAPTTIQVRYFLEDVPMSLVPISELGKAANVKTVNIDSVIQLSNAIFNKDFRKEGRNLKNMGLEGLSKQQIEHFFATGE